VGYVELKEHFACLQSGAQIKKHPPKAEALTFDLYNFTEQSRKVENQAFFKVDNFISITKDKIFNKFGSSLLI